jgi:hypothetical protein
MCVTKRSLPMALSRAPRRREARNPKHATVKLPIMSSHPPYALPLLLGWLAACSSAPSPPDSELQFLHERIQKIDDDPAGGAWVGFELSSRSYRIDPDLSPSPQALVAYARQAKSAGTPVHATFWDRDRLPKTPENVQRGGGRPIILVRLAADPDPRKGR